LWSLLLWIGAVLGMSDFATFLLVLLLISCQLKMLSDQLPAEQLLNLPSLSLFWDIEILLQLVFNALLLQLRYMHYSTNSLLMGQLLTVKQLLRRSHSTSFPHSFLPSFPPSFPPSFIHSFLLPSLLSFVFPPLPTFPFSPELHRVTQQMQ
jgi:hypothetical protein